MAPAPAPPAEPAHRKRRAFLLVVLLGIAALGVSVGGLVIARRPVPLNILLVTIDTLRADRLGAYGYAGAETPVFDALARRGTRFENVESAIPLTGPSHATIFTGQYPPVHGVRDNVVFPLDARHTTLATLLKRQGYRTAAFVAAYPVAASFGFGQGFDHFSEDFHEAPVGGQGAERPGNEVADAVLGWLSKEGKGPFFAWVHFYDPHTPYNPPPPFHERFRDRPYDGEVAFTDLQLGRLLDGLRVSGREMDTLVVVLADHGEALGEHNETTHAILIYEVTLRVPFVIAGPGIPAGRVVRERVGTVDVLPTILSLLGLERPPGLPGRNLRPALEGKRLPAEPLYAESLFGRLNCRWASLRGWVGEDWKLISTEGHEPELFNLAEDPDETRNRAAEEPERVKRMREALKSALRKMAPGGDTARAVAVSPEQEERLRSLGYVGGSGGSGSLDDPGLPDPRTHVQLYERVQMAMMARGPAVEKAIAEMAAVVSADGGNPFAHFALGNLAYRDGRLGLAAQAFAKALELDPDRPGMRLPFGRLLREMGRLEESERQLRIAVEQTTADDDRTRVSLAETLIARGKLEEAPGIIDRVLKVSPRHVEALGAKGRLLVAQGRAQEAIPFLQGAASGRDVDRWIELAETYLQLGRADKARESAGQALAASAGHPWALAVTGHALVLEGRREEGLKVLKQALSIRPRRPEVWMSLARAFDSAGDTADAALCRRQAAAAGRV